MTNDDEGEGGGSAYPPKMMTSFVNSPLFQTADQLRKLFPDKEIKCEGKQKSNRRGKDKQKSNRKGKIKQNSKTHSCFLLSSPPPCLFTLNIIHC